jgi:RNA polymerase sigma-70 factor (ECF subfamily)
VFRAGGVAQEGPGLPRSDEILVAKCQKGDKQAFELLIKKYQRRIFHLIYRITQDPAVVEPLAQDVFLKAYRSISSFRGSSRFYTWLYRIAVNTSLSHIKKESVGENRERTLEYELNSSSLQPDSMKTEDPEELFMRKEFFKHLLESLRRLPEELRTAVILREFSGMNYEEISEVMEIPLGTVRSRIFRARARLREMLEPYVYET